MMNRDIQVIMLLIELLKLAERLQHCDKVIVKFFSLIIKSIIGILALTDI